MEQHLKRITFKKLQLDQLQPLTDELKQGLEDWFQVELTYASNAIEGNTLTRVETAEVIARGIGVVVRGKSLKDQLEAINHSKAVAQIRQR
jgi:Fic family protein